MKSRVSHCVLSNKDDDEQYRKLLNRYKKLGPSNDSAFTEAIKILQRTSPSKLFKDLSVCKKNKTLSNTYRGSKNKSGTRRISSGGARSGSRSNSGSRGNTSKATPSKTLCYLKALAKLSGMTALLAGFTYNYIAPFLASASGVSPCEGYMDQVVGSLASIVWKAADCDYREQQTNNVIVAYTTALVSAVGVSGVAMITKSPTAFKLTLKYFAAKECPELFNNYGDDNYKQDMQSLKDAPTIVFPSLSRRRGSKSKSKSKSKSSTPTEGNVPNPNSAVPSRRRRR